MRILFLTQTSRIGPASRYRAYQYVPLLEKEGISCAISPALPERCFSAFYLSRNVWQKLPFCLLIAVRRFFDLFRVRKYDVIFIQREIIPQAFPLFEKIIAFLNKNVVFDFDDAIFLVPPQRKSLVYLFRCGNNIERIVRLSRLVITGNDYLKKYASRFNSNVEVLPTAIDTGRWQPGKKEKKEKIVIGWIGSMHTIMYLETISGVLKELAGDFSLRVLVIGTRDFSIKGVEVICRPWGFNSEVSDVNDMDIGVAPLFDDDWGRGKCGLKALQYMACGVPVVCSNAGVYKEIIQDGENGLLAQTQSEWKEKLACLLRDAGLRERIGDAGRRMVEKSYSLNVNALRLKILLEDNIEC